MIKKVLFSLDVEEFDIPEEYGQQVDPSDKIQISSNGLVRVLDLMDNFGIPITCFTTVFFAKSRPDLIERIISRHELASHGLFHRKFHSDDLLLSRLELERLSGRKVYGFRRPRLKAIGHSDILKAGYAYNSSENPIWLPGRYMNLFKPRLPYLAGNLVNLPISASPLIRYPLFWISFKNSPLWLFKKMSHWTLETDGYLNIFFHPWEFSNLDKWRLPAAVKRLSGNALLSRIEDYLSWLKNRTEFTTCSAFAEAFHHTSILSSRDK